MPRKTQVQHNVRKGILQGKLYSAANMAKENAFNRVHEDQVNVIVSWPNSVMENYYLPPSKTLLKHHLNSLYISTILRKLNTMDMTFLIQK